MGAPRQLQVTEEHCAACELLQPTSATVNWCSLAPSAFPAGIRDCTSRASTVQQPFFVSGTFEPRNDPYESLSRDTTPVAVAPHADLPKQRCPDARLATQPSTSWRVTPLGGQS